MHSNILHKVLMYQLPDVLRKYLYGICYTLIVIFCSLFFEDMNDSSFEYFIAFYLLVLALNYPIDDLRSYFDKKEKQEQGRG